MLGKIGARAVIGAIINGTEATSGRRKAAELDRMRSLVHCALIQAHVACLIHVIHSVFLSRLHPGSDGSGDVSDEYVQESPHGLGRRLQLSFV